MSVFSNNLNFLIRKSGKSQAVIANELGYSNPSKLSNYKNEHSTPSYEDLIQLARYFNANLNDLCLVDLENRGDYSTVNESKSLYEKAPVSLPLIPIEAMAGFAPGLFIDGTTESDLYSIPEFNKKADFLIRVSGTSMSPKYYHGDILACKKVPNKSFIQWGKVYVIDTEQGALCKRLYAGKREGELRVVSENSELYPEFYIDFKAVRSMAIVVGVIRIE